MIRTLTAAELASELQHFRCHPAPLNRGHAGTRAVSAHESRIRQRLGRVRPVPDGSWALTDQRGVPPAPRNIPRPPRLPWTEGEIDESGRPKH